MLNESAAPILNYQPTALNTFQRARREPGSAWSRRALRRSQLTNARRTTSSPSAARPWGPCSYGLKASKRNQPKHSDANSRVQRSMSVRASHPLRRLRPFGCPALDDSAGQAPLTPPSPQKSALRGEWRGEGGTLRPAQRAYAAPLPHFRGQRQHQLAALEDPSGGTLRCRSATPRCRAPRPRASRSHNRGSVARRRLAV